MARKEAKSRERKQNPDWVHVPDGMEEELTMKIARYVETTMRKAAIKAGADPVKTKKDKICPGCMMALMHNAIVELTMNNDHSMESVAGILARDFRLLEMKAAQLENGPSAPVEKLLEQISSLFRAGPGGSLKTPPEDLEETGAPKGYRAH